MLFQTLTALFVSLIFAGTGIAGKFLAKYGITPFMLAFIRFTISTILLLPFIKIHDIEKVNIKKVGYIFLMGFVGILLFNVLFFTALTYTSVITVSLIGATNPMIAMLVTSAIALKAPNKKQMAALICAFIGVSVVIIHDTAPSSNIVSSSNFGELLALASVCCQVCYALLARHMTNIFSPIFLACVSGAAGLIFIFPFIINTNFVDLWNSIDLTAILALLYIGTLGGAVSTTLYIKTVKKLGAALGNLIVFSCIPIFTAILSMILLGTAPTLYHFIGGLLVIIGLYVGLAKIRK